MISVDNERINKILLYGLALFGIVIGLYAFLIRYPADFFLPMLKAAGLIVEIVIYGYVILVVFRQKQAELIDACAVGLIFTTFYFYIISLFKILVPWLVYLFYLLPPVLLIFILIPRKSEQTRDFLRRSLREFFHRPAKEYLIFLIPLVYASLPSSFYDTLVYHLGIPNLYLLEGGFVPTPQFLYANTSVYYEISLIPAVFAGDMVPRLFHFFLAVIFGLSLVDFAVRFFDLKERFTLLLLLLSMPITVFLMATVKNDLLSAFFILAAIKHYMGKNYKLSALFWGFSVGIKYFNALGLVLFLAAAFIKEKKFNVKVVLIFGLIVVGILLPHFAKNYIFAGNPFFPFFHDFFAGPGSYFDDTRLAVMQLDVGKTVHSFRDFVRLPFTLSFFELGSGGILGAQFLIFLPFLLVMKKPRPKHLNLLLFSLLFLLAGSCFTSSLRFMYIAAALLAVFTVLVYSSLPLKILKFLFFIIIGLNFVAVFGYHERIYRSFTLYSGKLDHEQYKALTFPTYPAIAYVNTYTPVDARVMMAGETRNYYLKRPYTVATALDYSILKKYLAAGPEYEDFILALKQDGIQYIIFNSYEFQRLRNSYNRLTKEETAKFTRFLNRLKPVFKDKERGLYVFKIFDI